MPVSNLAIESALKRYWTSNTYDVMIVNAFQIEHPDFVAEQGANGYLLCDYGKDFYARLKSTDSSTVPFLATSLDLKASQIENSTNTRLVLTISSINGIVYTLLRKMNAQDRKTPISVTHRIYIDDDINPKIEPPTKFVVLDATVGLTSVTMNLSSFNMPNRRAGEYYTTDRFPSLLL